MVCLAMRFILHYTMRSDEQNVFDQNLLNLNPDNLEAEESNSKLDGAGPPPTKKLHSGSRQTSRMCLVAFGFGI